MQQSNDYSHVSNWPMVQVPPPIISRPPETTSANEEEEKQKREGNILLQNPFMQTTQYS